MRHNNTNPLNLSQAREAAQTANPATAGSKFSAVKQWLLRRLLRTAGNPAISVVLWDGQEITPAGVAPVGRIVIRSRTAFLKLLSHPDLQFGELYSSGQLEVEGDLVALMEAIGRSLPPIAERGRLINGINRLYLLKRNTMAKARDNIYHHYDIGNAFYQLWLDQQMVYTCAYFPSPALGLEQAQIAKLELVCRKLMLKPGETVVEAGCGWGALALYMARHYGVMVRAYNLSREQLAYARERARREGLAERVEFIEGDYRQIRGTYDVFVSVGMLEHVGLKHYGELGAVIDRCLKPTGRGLIHTIGRNQPAPMSAWIEKRIFPGAYPPSLGEMMQLFEPWRFSIVDAENLRLHYAETLRHWLSRYDAATDQVQAMFDTPFVRAWRLYLAGSIAAFTMGDLQLFQVVFTRYHNNAIPRSREFLYREAGQADNF